MRGPLGLCLVAGVLAGGLPAVAQDMSFTEEFADVASLAGWVIDNNSDVAGTLDWFQGNEAVFAAYSGEANGYIAANLNATGGSQISLWLISPVISFESTAQLRFWTRTATGSAFPDRYYVPVDAGPTGSYSD